MKYDEFAFVNQQLADMLKSGIPLEGALRQLSENMHRGKLRAELERLGADLSNGVPLGDALKQRRLPGFYVRMIQVGAQSNDLPGMLTLLADYYERLNAIWTRLKGLIVYPMIVLVASLALSVLVGFIYTALVRETAEGFQRNLFGPNSASTTVMIFNTWLPTMMLVVLVCGLVLASLIPACRNWMRWHLPGFKEASLSTIASSCGLMLKGGNDLNSSLSLLRDLECGTPAGTELTLWQRRLSEGNRDMTAVMAESKIFPPLFVWMIANSKDDLVGGFLRTAEIYYNRAVYRIEMILYAALPVAVLALGILILGQILPVFGALIKFMDFLDGGSSGL